MKYMYYSSMVFQTVQTKQSFQRPQNKFVYFIFMCYFQRPGEFDWDEAKQGIVLGSFFYGYVLTQVPGGRLAELFGGKLVYGIGVLVTAVFTFLSPIAARINFPFFIVVRVLEGMGEVNILLFIYSLTLNYQCDFILI